MSNITSVPRPFALEPLQTHVLEEFEQYRRECDVGYVFLCEFYGTNGAGLGIASARPKARVPLGIGFRIFVHDGRWDVVRVN